MKKMIMRLCVLTALIFPGLGVSHAMGQFMVMENALVGKKAPDFTLSTTEGKKVTLSELSAGSPTIVFFWATWCPHCREQLSVLNEQLPSLQQKGVKLVLVDLEEKAELVTKHMKKNGITLPVLLDENGEVGSQYAVEGVPTFFFLDKGGVVRAVEHGFLENYEQVIGLPEPGVNSPSSGS